MEETIYYQRAAQQAKLCLFESGKATVWVLQPGLFGRRTEAAAPPLAADSRAVSRRHGEFLLLEDGWYYRDLGSMNGTLCNGTALPPNTLQKLRDGDILRIHGQSDPACSMDVLLIFMETYHDGMRWKTLPLTAEIASVAVGRGETLALFDPSVSRRHASFFASSGGWAILDHHSLNGVLLNNRKLTDPQYLRQMDVVRIADYYFIFTQAALYYQEDAAPAAPAAPAVPAPPVDPVVPAAPADPVVPASSSAPAAQGRLSIWIEERNVWHRARKKTLLKDIQLELQAGSMVLVLGGSGAGKTTFLNAVMGYEQAEGQILYNGRDIYDEYEKMKYEIGYVPQQDLLRMNDTVYATLYNAAVMRLPAGQSQQDYAAQVEATMHMLGLEREKDSLVGKLSGGQRKRLSIAVELIGNPSLFFLDEPDSGLDGTMARALMENLRQIADQGKIVIVISHSPDRAFSLFDQVIVLAKDSRTDTGRLVFFGPPQAACTFFEVDHLEAIVKRINRTDEGGDGRADEFIDKFNQRGGVQ